MTKAHLCLDLNRLPGFEYLDKSVKNAIENSSTVRSIPTGQTVFTDHDACNDFIFIINGLIRVSKVTRDGHEITLFHLYPDQTCGLTASCLLGHTPQHANLITERKTVALFLQAQSFRLFMANSESFQSFVMQAVDHNLNTMIRLLEEVAFESIEHRLIKKIHGFSIQHSSTPQTRLCLTHQTLATELGTAREVVSRTLKNLEKKGLIALHRGTIDILDYPTLLKRLEK